MAEIAKVEVDPIGLWQLGQLWSEALAECHYAPLEAWFEQALRAVLVADERVLAQMFVWNLPADITDTMRSDLWAAIETRGYGALLEELFSSAAVRGTDPQARVQRTVAAFQVRQVSREWLYNEAGRMLEEYPEAYLHELNRQVDAMPDELLEDVLGSLTAYVRAGKLPDDSRELDALRIAVAPRDGVPAHLRVLRRSD